MTRLASDIREADKPIYCSSCFNSQPVRHVDFDAACDRGYGNDEAVKITMDDLILCENCVKEAGEILGMHDKATDIDKLADLERKLDVERKLRRQAQNYAGTMEEALTRRPEQVHIDHRKRPRKEIAA
jgi:hypothetical protein